MATRKNTKIIATVGPASSDADTLEQLILAGTDIFRLNFSHGTHQDHKAKYELIKALEQKHKRPLTILMDLQGPKLRIGKFKSGHADLKSGQPFLLTTQLVEGSSSQVTLPHPEIFATISPGDRLLLNDGKLQLQVESCDQNSAKTTVLLDGTLSDHKGLNVPGTQLPISALTKKDRDDLAFGLQLGIDCVALSFVQKPEDITEARALIKGRAKIISKIEKPSAITELEEIIALSDAIMVARGDLGVEMAPEEVPRIQKQIIRSCRNAGKPVIVATQMLESMIQAPTPTRAEASDVANAVYEGADAVMLSAESASGHYPVQSVSMMRKIINTVESDHTYPAAMSANTAAPESTAADAITVAASQVADTINAKVIVTFTTAGSTTLRAARTRPNVPILALTSNRDTANFLNIAWGTHPVIIDDVNDFSDISNIAIQNVLKENLATVGDRIVVTAGLPDDKLHNASIFTPGITNFLRIIEIKSAK